MTNQLRRCFQIRKRPPSYDVVCLYCHKQSRAWDYRANALLVGYTHVVMNHMAPMYHNASWIEDPDYTRENEYLDRLQAVTNS